MAPSSSSFLTRSDERRDDDEGIAPAAPGRIAPSRPTDFEMASAVVLETGCTQERADGLIEFLHRAVAGANENGIYAIPQADLERHHALFERVCPDEQAAGAGSAHATIEHGFGTTIMHTLTENQCALAVGVGREHTG